MFLRKACRSLRMSKIAANSIVGVVALISLFGCGSDSAEQTSQTEVIGDAELSSPLIPEIHLQSGQDSEEDLPDGDVDLFSLVNIEDCRISGSWTIEDQGIVSPNGNGLKLQIPYSPPEEYELIYEVEPLEPPRGLAIGLLNQGNPFHALIGYYGKSNGLEQVQNKDINSNGTRTVESALEVGKKSTVRCIVKKGSVQIRVDDQQLINWEGESSELSRNGYWSMPMDSALWIGGFGSFRFHSGRCVPITGRGKQTLTPNLVSDTAIENARQVFGPALDDVMKITERVGGRVSLEQNENGDTRLKFSLQGEGTHWKKLTNADLETFSKLKGPVNLNLKWLSSLPDQGLVSLSDMDQLEVIEFWGCSALTDELFRQLPVKSLKYVGVRSSKVTDSVADHLAKMTNLTSVDLHLSESGDGLLKVLGQLPALKTAIIGSSHISDTGIESLCHNKSLEDIRIWNSDSAPSLKVTERSLGFFNKLPALKRLEIKRTGIQQSSADTFRSKHPKVSLVYQPANSNGEGNSKNAKVAIQSPTESDQSVPISELIEKYPQDKPVFEQQLARAKDRIQRYSSSNRKGYLVVGQIKLENSGRDAPITTQVQITDNGFFASAVRDPAKPMGIQAHQYLPMNLIAANLAKPNQDGVYDVGVIEMTKTPPAQLGSVKGHIELENSDSAFGATARLSLGTSAINSLSGGTQGVSRRPLRLSQEVSGDGRFAFSKLSPGRYILNFSMPNFVPTYRIFEVKPGEATDLGTIPLDRQRDVEIEYVVEKIPVQKFDISQRKKITVKTGDAFKSRDDMYGTDLRFISKSREVRFDVNYAPCSIMDMGEGDLSDFVDFNIDKFKGVYPERSTPKIGHVYLLNQGHWKHYVLFRINSVVENKEAASTLSTRQTPTNANPSTDAAEKRIRTGSYPTVSVKIDSRPRYPSDVKTLIAERIEELQAKLKDRGLTGQIIAGKIDLGNAPAFRVPQLVAMQGQVYEDGFFVTAIHDKGKPILVTATGFIPSLLDLKVVPDDQVVTYLQPVQLEPLPEKEQRIISGYLSLRPPGPLGTVIIRATPAISKYLNSPFAPSDEQQEGALGTLYNQTFRPLTSTLSSSLRLRISSCSTMPYYVTASATGYESVSAIYDGVELHPPNLYMNAKDPLVESERWTSQEISVDDVAPEIIADQVVPLQKQLMDRENTFGVVAQVTLKDPPTDFVPLSVMALNSSTSSSYSNTVANTTDNFWFVRSSTINTRSTTQPQLRIRAFGYLPVDIPLDTTSGEIEYMKVTLHRPAEDKLGTLSVRLVDSRGKALANCPAELSFTDLVHAYYGGFGANSNHSNKFILRSNQNGFIDFPNLASSWYRLNINVEGYGEQYRPRFIETLFLEEGATQEQFIIVPDRQAAELEFVSQSDGKSIFSGRSKRLSMLESRSIPLSDPKGGSQSYYLNLFPSGDSFRFQVSGNSGGWIVDLGEIELSEVKDAQKYKPSTGAPYYYQNNSAEFKENHVYVVGTPDNRFIKFKAIKLTTPK